MNIAEVLRGSFSDVQLMFKHAIHEVEHECAPGKRRSAG